MDDLLLEAKELVVNYKIPSRRVNALEKVSLGLHDKESFGLVGESGCGKTTLALAIMRLLPQNAEIISGKILYKGEDLLEKSERDMNKIRCRKISILFQSSMNALNPMFKVKDQLAEAISDKYKEEKVKKRVDELLSSVGLDPSKRDSYPHELSGGMKQRVMTAMAISNNPDVVILDEPTTALDVIVQAQIIKMLKDLQEKLRISTILITHNLSLIAEMCDRVAVMYAGKIFEQGNVSEIIGNAKNPYTIALMKSFPCITSSREEPLVSLEGYPPDLTDPPTGCRFHPRCAEAKEICKELVPPTVMLEKEHTVACHLYK